MVYDRPNIKCTWNVPAPWKPKTQSPLAAVKGGGKGAIVSYYTPMRARTVIAEFWGENFNPNEIYPYLVDMCAVTTGDLIIVTPKLLQSLHREEWLIEEMNQNPYTFREVLVKNMGNFARSQANYLDYKYLGKYYN